MESPRESWTIDIRLRPDDTTPRIFEQAESCRHLRPQIAVKFPFSSAFLDIPKESADKVSGLGAIWKSTDFGATWTVQAPPDRSVGVAVVNPDTIDVSRDGGANWTTQPDVLFDVSAGFA